jgi:hypothetical protein
VADAMIVHSVEPIGLQHREESGIDTVSRGLG